MEQGCRGVGLLRFPSSAVTAAQVLLVSLLDNCVFQKLPPWQLFCFPIRSFSRRCPYRSVGAFVFLKWTCAQLLSHCCSYHPGEVGREEIITHFIGSRLRCPLILLCPLGVFPGLSLMLALRGFCGTGLSFLFCFSHFLESQEILLGGVVRISRQVIPVDCGGCSLSFGLQR